MTTMRTMMLGGLAAALLSLPAFAQMGPGGGMGGMGGMRGAGGMGPGMGGQGAGPRTLDCSKAPDPQQCAAHNKALEVCGTQRGPAHRECMEDNMPAPDCSKARNPQQCEAMEKARSACKGKYGPERATCLRENRPAPTPRGPRQGGMGGMGPGMGSGMGPGMGGAAPTK